MDDYKDEAEDRMARVKAYIDDKDGAVRLEVEEDYLDDGGTKGRAIYLSADQAKRLGDWLQIAAGYLKGRQIDALLAA